ncbi:hypothetical protein [Paraherbaspirillum soli]|uniref:Uncharacterized protein n=1 Tax=Paraherbaspirillum soli TaxID=631222 RepID=A0ABW0M7F7_9BURK
MPYAIVFFPSEYMKTLLALLAFAGLINPAFAAPSDDAAKQALVGHYYLQGKTELGSELLLKNDGRFQWTMSYGAEDRFAQGRWSLDKGEVALVAVPPDKEPVFRLFREDELRIVKPADAGSWVAIVGVPNVGPAVGMEVKFESKSGKTVTAKTDRNGDAEVSMPADETWARAGLRRSGDWQWFAIPAERAAARIASFALDDVTQILPQAFEHMELKVRDGRLEMDEGMVYVRE